MEQDDIRLLTLKLDNLTKIIEQGFEVIRGDLSDHEDRLRKLEGERIGNLEQAVVRLSERLTIWQMAQSAYSTAVGIVAAFFGGRP